MSREPSAGSSEGKLPISEGDGGALLMNNKVWIGIDASKEFHWVHVLDATGTELLCRRVENDDTSAYQ